MKKRTWVLLILILTIAASAWYLESRGAEQAQESGKQSGKDFSPVLVSRSTQVVDQGQVELTVHFEDGDTNPDYWVFDIELNTHSVNLDAIDLPSYVMFMGRQNVSSADGIRAERTGSGHHVSDQLFIPKRVNGEWTIDDHTSSVKLTFSGIGGSTEGSAEWELEVKQ